MKEAFAAQLTHADHEFGRIVDTLERIGQLVGRSWFKRILKPLLKPLSVSARDTEI
jgi:hypothetical protein